METNNPIEKALSEAITLLNEDPSAVVDDKIWYLLLLHVPQKHMLRRLEDIRMKPIMEAFDEALSDPNVWCESCQHEVVFKDGYCRNCFEFFEKHKED